MTLFIGTDEAGYGPNLGPLTITATAWQFPPGTTAEQCWQLVATGICRSAPKNPDQLQVADSKQVYAAGRSLEPLERSVLTLLRQLQGSPKSLAELGTTVCGPDFLSDLQAEPCRAPAPQSVPVATKSDVLAACHRRLQQTLQAADVRLLEIRTRAIFPAEFNRLVAACGTKGRVLSAATLQLVADIVRDQKLSEAQIICDKHGGRNRYDALLSEAFDDRLVFRLEEGRQLSRYRMDQLEFRFQTRAEEHLPVAAASMVSKYLREVAMLDFNAFWTDRIEGLRPTKGYPVDAARFMLDIDESLQASHIPRDDIFRCR